MVANDPAHGHRLYMFLRRFSFPESVLDGAVEHCLGSSARRDATPLLVVHALG